MFHPVPWEFHQIHHPSYIDFFEEVLAETTDPKTIESKFEEKYATDPWYQHLYRTSHAYHGVHPFYMWCYGARTGRSHCGRRHLRWGRAEVGGAFWATGARTRCATRSRWRRTRWVRARRSRTSTRRPVMIADVH